MRVIFRTASQQLGSGFKFAGPAVAPQPLRHFPHLDLDARRSAQ